MTTCAAVNRKAVREYTNSAGSLVDAEELRDMLRSHPLPGNPYYDDAVERAETLVDEMNADLDDVMSRWTPEECGL